jgi:hypothetical protein
MGIGTARTFVKRRSFAEVEEIKIAAISAKLRSATTCLHASVHTGKSESMMKLHCSFCGKSNDEVAKLVAGPMFICNECHAAMADIMTDATAPPPPPPEPSPGWKPIPYK